VIEGFCNGPVILIHIPRSWAAPHMVSTGTDSRFHTRGSAGKQSMDVREIRSAFLLHAEVSMLIRRFREERLGRIMSDETPVMLDGPTRLVLHVVPFSSVGVDSKMIDLEPWAKESLPPLATRGWNHRYNSDGFLTFNGQKKESQRSYLQVFRSGALEGVVSLSRRQGGRFSISPWRIEQMIFDELPRYIRSYKKFGIEAPFVILISLLSVKGARLPVSESRADVDNWDENDEIERDALLLPDVIVKDYVEPLGNVMRPAFDALWQALGISGSLCYDEGGNWNGADFRW
jgi:hypothetical protein